MCSACGSDVESYSDSESRSSDKVAHASDDSSLESESVPATNNQVSESSKKDDSKEMQIVEVEDISEIIKNPVSAKPKPKEQTKVPKMSFQQESFDFGWVMEGDTVHHDFIFTNTGKSVLIISEARSTCGCTIPEWPKYPIEPGQTDTIKARFETKGKIGRQTKPITVIANTIPKNNVVKLVGVVDTPRN